MESDALRHAHCLLPVGSRRNRLNNSIDSMDPTTTKKAFGRSVGRSFGGSSTLEAFDGSAVRLFCLLPAASCPLPALSEAASCELRLAPKGQGVPTLCALRYALCSKRAKERLRPSTDPVESIGRARSFQG